MALSWLLGCGPHVHFSVNQQLQRSISPTRATAVGETAQASATNVASLGQNAFRQRGLAMTCQQWYQAT